MSPHTRQKKMEIDYIPLAAMKLIQGHFHVHIFRPLYSQIGMTINQNIPYNYIT